MDDTTHDELVREFSAARRNHGAISNQALSNLKSFSEAYRLQERVRDTLGAKVVGWKLAAPPSADVISAPLFDTVCFGSNAVIANPALLRDGVECELAFRIDHPLPTAGCTRDDVIKAVGEVMPAFELLCSRLPSKFSSPREQIVADGMGQGGVVLGAPCPDWRALELDKLRVTLWSDDKVVVTKQGGNPFGDPLHAIALLADHLGARHQALEVGTFVLAGSHTGVHRAVPGERVRCLFEGVGEVALTVSEAEEHSNVGR